MILTDEMLTAAFRYRKTDLWKDLEDCDIFAFRLSDGETGYCCIMGKAGTHLAVGFYRGAKGFTSYLKTITPPVDEKIFREELLALEFINCDFMNSADTVNLDENAKAKIREFAKTNDFKICRTNGWPDFSQHLKYARPFGITEPRDAQDITEALNAAICVATEIAIAKNNGENFYNKLGFTANSKYPSAKGGKTVPFLIPNGDGTYTWSQTKLPALVKDRYPKVKYKNQIMTARLTDMEHHGTMQCKLIHLMAPLKTAQDKTAFFPSMLLCVEENTQTILPITPQTTIKENHTQRLHDLATVLLNAGRCPAIIKVADEQTMCLLEDFCSKTGIKLLQGKDMQELYDAWDYISFIL